LLETAGALDAPPLASALYRPPWFVSALFNELYYLVDGGTLWGRPLTVAGLEGGVETAGDTGDDSGTWDGENSRTGDARDSGDGDGIGVGVEDDCEREEGVWGAGGGEDGEGGDASDVTGNGGEWGGSLGRFGLMECFDYPLYNTLDVHFYGSWPLALMWPGLDLAVVADLSAAVDSSDDTERPITWMQGKGGAPRRRKVRGTAPHDLGAPFDAPLTSSPNAFDFVDVNGWKDLAPKLMLMIARAHALRGGFHGPEAPGGLPKDVLKRWGGMHKTFVPTA
jgi:non-lysosomal glucosylceramidase